MDLTKLTRHSHRRDRPGLPLLGRFGLAGARAHELCGTARRRLALWIAAGAEGPIMWIRPAWHPDRLHMAGVRAEIDPARLIFVEPERPADLLWSMEEALRAGVLPLVICDLPEPPGLTPVRRLHLAAEAGIEARGGAGLGLLLTPGDGGAAGVESRWRLEPAHGAEETGWRLARLRARDAPPGEWAVTRDTQGRPRVVDGRVAEPA
jgi:protein ImuA